MTPTSAVGVWSSAQVLMAQSQCEDIWGDTAKGLVIASGADLWRQPLWQA